MQSVVDTAITDTEFTEALPTLSGGLSYAINSIGLLNTSSVSTSVDIAAGEGVAWSLPAPANKATTKNFNPPLLLPANRKLALRARAAASITGTVDYDAITFSRLKIEDYPSIELPIQSYSYTPATPVSGARFAAFDGADDSINMGAQAALNSTSPWSVGYKIRISGGRANDMQFFSNRGSTGTGIIINTSGNGPQGMVYDGTRFMAKNMGDAYKAFNTWKSIFILYDGSETLDGLTIYVNNTLQPPWATSNVLIGEHIAHSNDSDLIFSPPAASHSFHADVMELFIYDKVVTADTIAAHHAGTEITEEPILHVPFNNTSGTTVTAETGSGGTLSGDDGTNFWQEIA